MACIKLPASSWKRIFSFYGGDFPEGSTDCAATGLATEHNLRFLDASTKICCMGAAVCKTWSNVFSHSGFRWSQQHCVLFGMRALGADASSRAMGMVSFAEVFWRMISMSRGGLHYAQVPPHEILSLEKLLSRRWRYEFESIGFETERFGSLGVTSIHREGLDEIKRFAETSLSESAAEKIRAAVDLPDSSHQRTRARRQRECVSLLQAAAGQEHFELSLQDLRYVNSSWTRRFQLQSRAAGSMFQDSCHWHIHCVGRACAQSEVSPESVTRVFEKDDVRVDLVIDVAEAIVEGQREYEVGHVSVELGWVTRGVAEDAPEQTLKIKGTLQGLGKELFNSFPVVSHRRTTLQGTVETREEMQDGSVIVHRTNDYGSGFFSSMFVSYS
eukprot:TRINITY_DN22692_c0_g1_i1.p1 TRINITY_DN22692_c0_g1~~TRINITY_DN22692_c0_g1_i1.p1  ORF type:complete len:386 (+),score=45.23 TRINITY_DN22692_c0_g1_i1:55-1212(+)